MGKGPPATAHGNGIRAHPGFVLGGMYCAAKLDRPKHSTEVCTKQFIANSVKSNKLIDSEIESEIQYALQAPSCPNMSHTTFFKK